MRISFVGIILYDNYKLWIAGLHSHQIPTGLEITEQIRFLSEPRQQVGHFEVLSFVRRLRDDANDAFIRECHPPRDERNQQDTQQFCTENPLQRNESVL